MRTCLYCPNPGDSLEHPLPAAFGEFQNAPFLENRICERCNNTRLGRLDEQLTRCGPEAVMRRFFGVQGRKNHEEVNPHYRGSAGGHRLEMTAFDTEMGVEVELETFQGQVRQSRQMIVVDADGKAHHLPIPDGLRDPEKLRASYLKLGVTNPADVRLVCDSAEREWLEPLVKAAWPTVSFAKWGLGARNYENGAVVKLQLTDRYFRALAKIGFHYFLTQFPTYDGSEVCFSDVRKFIIEDSGGLDRVNTFVGVRSNPLLTPLMDGAVPNGWIAHVLCVEIREDECLAHVQFFVCKDYRSQVYTIRLGANGSAVPVAATGHIYKYFGGGREGRFSGEARSLSITRVVADAPPLKSAIAPRRC